MGNYDGVTVGRCVNIRELSNFDPQIHWTQMVVNLDAVKCMYTLTICDGRTSDNKSRNTQSLTRVLIVLFPSHLGPPCLTRRGHNF
jgi:hypothetical protein